MTRRHPETLRALGELSDHRLLNSLYTLA
jgi:hypothetical protein